MPPATTYPIYSDIRYQKLATRIFVAGSCCIFNAGSVVPFIAVIAVFVMQRNIFSSSGGNYLNK